MGGGGIRGGLEEWGLEGEGELTHEEGKSNSKYGERGKGNCRHFYYWLSCLWASQHVPFYFIFHATP